MLKSLNTKCHHNFSQQRNKHPPCREGTHYCTLDALPNALTNENYPLTYKSSSYINLNMFVLNATGHITTSEITVIYSIYLSLYCKLII